MSESYNPAEKLIARFLSNTPRLKKSIKLIYSYLFYLIKKKGHKHSSIGTVEVIKDNLCETFFGYYDKSPDNGKGLVLVYSTELSTTNLPKSVDSIKLDVYCLKSRRFILPKKIDVLAFNWQQASRAHWLDEDKFVYNNYDEKTDSYQSSVYSISLGKLTHTYKKPVQDSFKNEFMLSICYRSLTLLRPDYGYFKHKSNNLPGYDETGIWKTNYLTGEEELLFSINDVIKFKFKGNSENFKHKLNHVMISPTGRFFIFMHRYYNRSGRRYDRLILSDSNGNILRVLANNQMVSHCYWYDNDKILGYLRSPEGKDGYWLIDINSGDYSVYHEDVFANRGDGHPSVNGNYIVTDTYPNKSRMECLYLTKKNSSSEILIGEFFHGFNFSGETRCDLHPRFSKDGNTIFFDSVFSGQRQLCYIDINVTKKKLDDDV